MKSILATAALVFCSACTVTGDGGGGASGFGSGGPVCDPDPDDDESCPDAPGEPQGGCQNAADCCHGRQPAATTGFAAGCPGDYPNNWSCMTGNCVHGGCSVDADCVLEGFTCESVAGATNEMCVHKCTDVGDCFEAQMPGASCIGDILNSNELYCVEDLS